MKYCATKLPLKMCLGLLSELQGGAMSVKTVQKGTGQIRSVQAGLFIVASPNFEVLDLVDFMFL